MKKFVLWFIVVAIVVSISAVALASFTDTEIQVSFRNIKIIHNGEEVKANFEPFIYNGHVYVSLKDIARIFNVPISWDSENSSVILGCPDKSYYSLAEIPFMKEQLEEQENGTFVNIGSSYNEVLSGIRFATIRDKVFKDALVFGGASNEYFKFKLDKKFETFSFIAGVTDDSVLADTDDFAIIKIYGDSELLYTSPPLMPNSNAVFMNIPVKDVEVLRIEKEIKGTSIIKVAVANGMFKIYKK
jgi:hypothetical protein